MLRFNNILQVCLSLIQMIKLCGVVALIIKHAHINSLANQTNLCSN